MQGKTTLSEHTCCLPSRNPSSPCAVSPCSDNSLGILCLLNSAPHLSGWKAMCWCGCGVFYSKQLFLEMWPILIIISKVSKNLLSVPPFPWGHLKTCTYLIFSNGYDLGKKQQILVTRADTGEMPCVQVPLYFMVLSWNLLAFKSSLLRCNLPTVKAILLEYSLGILASIYSHVTTPKPK